MIEQTVNLPIPFDLLLKSVASLSPEAKWRLWKVLDEQIAQAEEEEWENDLSVAAEIREARAAYEAGDFVTLEQYMAEQHQKAV